MIGSLLTLYFRQIVPFLFVTFFIATYGQSFSPTSAGTIGSNSAPTGWSASGSPDYSSINNNGYDGTTNWTTTLPPSPSGDTTFPVIRSTSPNEAISQTITGLASGATYTFTVHYMFPTATGTFATNFNRPVSLCAYVQFDGGALQYLDTFGYLANTNTWYTQTFSVTSSSTSINLQLGLTGINANRAATAFSFTTAPSIASLPVDLIQFNSETVSTNSVRLHWTTALEINNSHFEVLRSWDGENFESICQIPGFGNSEILQSYSYVDTEIMWLRDYLYYKLKQVDFDGKISFSKTISLEKTKNDQRYIVSIDREKLVVTQDLFASKVTVSLSDVSGKTTPVNILNTHAIDISALPSGIYYLIIQKPNARRVQKFVKVRT